MINKETELYCKDNTDESLQIRIAERAGEKREIYRLRYEVYVEEMGKALGAIAKKRKQIYDPLDERSILIYVQAGSAIIATMRLTIQAAEDYPADLAEVFQMHEFKTLHNRFSLFGLGTKLAVVPQYRSSPAFYLILAEAYRLLREQNASICFTGGNPYLVPLYERVGFRQFTRNFTDPGYGLLVPLVLLLEDTDHMKAVRSPLYRHARKYFNDLTTAQAFGKGFPEAGQVFNTQLVTAESLWEYVEDQLSRSPLAIPVFRHLDGKSAMELLRAGAIFSCSPGDCIVYEGGVCNDFYLLLAGSLTSQSKPAARLLRPGDHFGGLMLPGGSRQTEAVSAITGVELFVLPRQAFERYQHLYPEAAAVFVRNLKETQNLDRTDSITEQGGYNHE
ncbi:acyl-coa n-acyltransferase [Lucifera butyrica]|uniref:Acyl-coa n-acyltransferase n=1 Tax=Lucifera butyrica TaxID=1351585 RepID=A0A498R6V8_9FIRM|nr:cyclic nucleotide-binding domain-containing protein [Lucifera butyrica]VBB05903.1 acyl-coa n-acyltransferase [Lucifera butyrica]